MPKPDSIEERGLARGSMATEPAETETLACSKFALTHLYNQMRSAHLNKSEGQSRLIFSHMYTSFSLYVLGEEWRKGAWAPSMLQA